MSKKTDRHIKGPGPWCGTPGGYSNHACKCDACKAAWAEARRAYMARNPKQREQHRARNRTYQPQEASA